MKYLRVSFFLFLLCVIVPSVVAQTTSETQGSDLLPDINPQDIEIKGDYRIKFPGLQRQPILGFDPRPRVFQLDPNRIPFLESSDEVVASIPISPLEIPKSPVRDIKKKQEARNGWMLGGYGLHQAPEAELGFQHIDQGNYRIGAFVSHLSSPDLGFSVPSDFYRWKGSLNYTEIIDRGFTWSTQLNGGLFKNQAPVSTTATETQRVSNWGFSTQLQRIQNPWEHWNAQLTYSGINQELGLTDPSELQHVLDVKLEKFWTLETPMSGMGMGANGTFSTYDVAGVTEQYTIAHLYGRYAYRSGTNRKVTLGIDPYFSKDAQAARFLIYPTLLIDFYGLPSSTLRAGLYGEVSNSGRLGFFTTSPFVNNNQLLLNNRGWVMFVNYELEMMKRSTIYGGFDLKRYTQFGFINYQADVSNPAVFAHDIAYNEAQIVRLKGGFSYRLTAPEISFNAEAWILNHQLKGGAQIPYMERFGVKTDVLWFLQSNWYVQPELVFLAGREGLNTSQSVLVVNAKTRYAFTKHWAAYLKVNNLTGADYRYWSDFQEWPLFLTGGLNLTF